MSPAAWTDILNIKGLTLTQAAELADIQRATLSGLSGGHARASVPMAHAIANAVGCHPETLFPTLRAVFVEAEQVAA
jgi:plasmid maintenance system antidote protein VapI